MASETDPNIGKTGSTSTQDTEDHGTVAHNMGIKRKESPERSSLASTPPKRIRNYELTDERTTTPRTTEDMGNIDVSNAFQACVIHEKALAELHKSPKSRCASFLAFEHNETSGTHLHLVWGGSESVRRRTCAAILRSLGINSDHEQAIIPTLINVKMPTKFLAYCYRGSSSMKLFGRNKYLQHWIDYIAPHLPSSVECNFQKINAMSRKDPTDRNLSKLQELRNIVSPYCTNSVPSRTEFKRQLSEDDHSELFRLFSNFWDSYVYKELERQEIMYNARITSTPMVEHLFNRPHGSTVQQFFSAWFTAHDINPEWFIACFCAIIDKQTKKRNCFLLRGGSNAGKSLFVKLLLGSYPVARLGRARDLDSFHWMPMLSKPVCVYEEMRLYPPTVDDYKCVLGGEDLDINVKNQSHQTLTRRPVIATSQHDVCSSLSTADTTAIKNRIIEFRVKDIPIGGDLIPSPSKRLTPNDLSAYINTLSLQTIQLHYNGLCNNDDYLP